ncbi:MAG: endonuclease/exonuclease/phosphatase family protein [Verrucomicrobiota bacterium]
MKAQSILLVFVHCFYPVVFLKAQVAEFQVVSWNVESDGSRISTIARQIREDFENVELWGLSEVAGDEAAAQFESSAEESEDLDYGRITGTTGGRDRLVILFDQARFELREAVELNEINVSGTVRAPLVARLQDKSTGQKFSFMVNHLYRGSSAGRHQQATLLNEWAGRQTESVIAVGDYNFDWHYQTGDQDHDEGYDNMIAQGRWKWIRPQVLVPTNASGHESVLDFIFLSSPGNGSSEWDSSSEILVRTNDFPDDNLKSDHRPVLATFEHLQPRSKPLSAPVASLPMNEGPQPNPVAPKNRINSPAATVPDSQVQSEAGTAPPTPAVGRLEIKYRVMEREHPGMERNDDNGLERALARAGAAAPRFVIAASKRWAPGQTITVAFRGGNNTLHKKIAEGASQWLNYGNLKFDFGVDQAGNYRKWATSDTQPAAHIRVSFDRDGYYSLVGTDALNRHIASSGEDTMNFDGFDYQLPPDWMATVLHEFGHAIGFEHEHQHPDGGCDFRWDDDQSYERTLDSRGAVIADRRGRHPGIYSVLGGWPNEWDKGTVDHNLRQLRDSSAYLTSEFDSGSIMKYAFDGWMFVHGEQSKCYATHDNSTLSPFDQQGMATAYPSERRSIELKNTERVAAINSILEVVDRIEAKNVLETLKNLK